LHPDRGGDLAAFQHVTELKRLLDTGETVRLDLPAEPQAQPPPAADLAAMGAAERMYWRVRAELAAAGAQF
jgi:hypothetical protein